MRQLPEKEMVSAMTESDSSYDGKFYVGVLSTGIYCLPSCGAKIPLLKNVKFFGSREEAIVYGLRGCKRCRSEKFPDVMPEWVQIILKYMKENYKEKLNQSKLMEITGVDISTIRRYFKTYHNSNPLAFHRKLRLNYAMQLIKEGRNYLDAAYESGWESSSGFRQAFKQQFGQPPGRFYNHAEN